MNDKAYEALSMMSEDDWRPIILRLGWYALGECRRLRWRTRNARELPAGETVDSIVSKAIEKLFSGERNWDPGKQPLVEKYLKGVISSLLNHLAEGGDNTKCEAMPEQSDISGDPDVGFPDARTLRGTYPSPEESILE
jgi:hypothetical protein